MRIIMPASVPIIAIFQFAKDHGMVIDRQGPDLVFVPAEEAERKKAQARVRSEWELEEETA